MNDGSSRRHFLKVGAAAVALPLLVGETPTFSTSTKSSLEVARKKAAHRKRRIIFNNDGDDAFVVQAATIDAFLAVRSRPCIDTQIDTVFYCTTQDIGYYSHRSKIAQHFTRDIPWIPITAKVKLVEALAKQGTDVLEVTTKYLHDHGKEVFWSHRMNGMEDNPPSLIALLGNFKRNHPQWWLGKAGDENKYPPGDHRHWYRVLDYAVPEVREYVLSIFREVIENYDIDGIELDYLRDPWLFKETFSDPIRPVTAEHCQLMVEFHKEIRAMLDEKSRRIGRPLLLALRVPHWVDIAQYLGWDIEANLKSGAVDLLIGGGGYTPFTVPPREFISLAHKYDVPVYVCISKSGMMVRGGRKGSRRDTLEAWRAAATNLWDAGADGQYIFNTMPGDGGLADAIVREIGDPRTMAGKEMVFALDTWDDMADHGWANPAWNRQGVLPVRLSQGLVWYYVDFYVGTDVSKLANVVVGLRAWFRGVAEGDEVILMLNGEPVQALPGQSLSGEYADHSLKPSQLRYRTNRLGACVKRSKEGKKEPIELAYMELTVRPAGA